VCSNSSEPEKIIYIVLQLSITGSGDQIFCIFYKLASRNFRISIDIQSIEVSSVSPHIACDSLGRTDSIVHWAGVSGVLLVSSHYFSQSVFHRSCSRLDHRLIVNIYDVRSHMHERNTSANHLPEFHLNFRISHVKKYQDRPQILPLGNNCHRPVQNHLRFLEAIPEQLISSGTKAVQRISKI